MSAAGRSTATSMSFSAAIYVRPVKSRLGRKLCVLEQHYTAGGFNRSYERDLVRGARRARHEDDQP